MRNAKLMIAGLTVWCVLVMVGVGELYGRDDSGPSSWPQTSALPRAEGKPTVVLFVRGDAPAARGQLAELAALIEPLHARPFVEVVFVGGAPPAPLWAAAGKLRNAVRLIDRDGSEARRFGATGPSQVQLFDRDGVRRYVGGDVIAPPAETRTLLAGIRAAS